MTSELSTLHKLAGSDAADAEPGFFARRLRKLIAPARKGRLVIYLPRGGRLEHSGDEPGVEATVAINSWHAVWQAIKAGSNGFADAYIAGQWSSPDLARLLEWLTSNRFALTGTREGTVLSRLADRIGHGLRANTKRNSRRNIAAHYDLGNAFYAQWLDRGMNYSSALYETPEQSLEEAQASKIRRIEGLLQLSSPARVLEIGCGWGAMMEHLARRGHHVTGLTLSREQQAYAAERLQANCPDKGWDVRLEDYRDVGGTYDRIVSVEMVEAVGEAYWPTYFRTVYDRLKPGGIAVIQAILIEGARYDYYRQNPDFIQRQIFPGGMLPTRGIVERQIAEAGMTLGTTVSFGESYARTLKDWRARFLAGLPTIEKMGFDARFKRLWEFYLAYCEAGFRQGAVDVQLIQFRKPALVP